MALHKIKLKFLKFMTSKPGKQAIATHTLHNISRNKGNQTMKLGQLIEYSMRNIFPEKSYTKWGGATILFFQIMLCILRVTILVSQGLIL